MLALLALLCAAAATAKQSFVQPCTTSTCESKPLGCFHDNNDHRVLSGANLTSSAMTVEMCLMYCSSLSSPFAGVEFGGQCFCGPEQPPANMSAPSTDCNMPCKGNSSQTCGAAGRINVYSDGGCKNVLIPLPFCNSSLPKEQRIDDLLSRLSLDDKVTCMVDQTCSLPHWGLYQDGMWKESLHGLRYPCAAVASSPGEVKCATSFPHAQMLAATFNRSAWWAVGDRIASEARGFYNAYIDGSLTGGSHALSFFAPDENLCRDPRWGRCVEVPGEDPFLTGEYARQYVSAMQQTDSSGVFKAQCNLKHFNSYDVESGMTSQGTGAKYNRGSFNAFVSVRDLVEYYFRQFRTTSMAADPRGVMCSYNAETWGNGNPDSAKKGWNVPSCANDVFNNGILRGADFNFTGMIVSDCSAISGIMNSHRYTNTTGTTVLAALQGGTDLNCGSFYAQYAKYAVGNKTVSMDLINRAVRRVLTQEFYAGTLDAEPAWGEYSLEDIDTDANRELALETSTQGMVLLNNSKKALPIKKGARIALVGPHINSSTCMLGNYYGSNNLVFSHTPLLAFQRRSDVDVVAFAEGSQLAGNDTSGFAAAEAAARQADVVVLMVGLTSGQGAQVNNTPAMEREGFDRTFLTLPQIQRELSARILAVGKPVVAVLMNSGGLAAPELYGGADAVLESFYPGELGGDAIADVVMGDVAPAGRMPTSIYPSTYTAERNITDMELRPHTNPWGASVPGVTYRYMPDSQLIYPFGYGESYTTWEITAAGSMSVTQDAAALASLWKQYYAPGRVSTGFPAFSVTVKNTGSVPSAFVVLGFLSNTEGMGKAPLRQLFDFERLPVIAPGASATVTLHVPPQSVTVVDDQGDETISAGKWTVSVGGQPQGFVSGTLILSGSSVTPVFEFPASG